MLQKQYPLFMSCITDYCLCQLNATVLMRPIDLLQGSKSFFSEIISSVADMKWSSDGRYILARDYMNLKLWDLNMESAPVATYSVHEHLRAKASSATWQLSCSSDCTVAELKSYTLSYGH